MVRLLEMGEFMGQDVLHQRRAQLHGGPVDTGRVRINWATMQLRPSLVEYVLAHELAHLKEPHHGPSFWNLLARVQPDYIERRTELARVGASIWIGANE